MRTRRPAALALVAAGATALAAVAMVTGVTGQAERAAQDARFDVRGDRAAPRDVAVVAIDDRSFAQLDQHYPFSRRLDAQVVRRLTAAGVRAVVYDVQFTEATQPKADSALIAAVDAAPHPVLATTEADHGRTRIFGGDHVVRGVGARAGNGVVPTDGDGAVRRFHRSFDGLASLPEAAVAAASGRPISVPSGEDQWIDYAGGPGTVDTYSFVDVLRGEVPAGRLRGRIVVVGATAPSLNDVHTTSTTGADEVMSGPEIQANAIDTLLHGVPLRDAPLWLTIVLVLLAGLLVPLSAVRVRAAPALLAIAVALAGLLALGAYAAFAAGWMVPVAGPALALALSTVGAMVVLAFYAAVERERTRAVFARFVDAPVVEQLLAGEAALGGVEVEATVLFADLRGSTALLEHLEPTVGLELLNRFLSAMADTVLAHGGTLIGYRGDGLVALFGAPLVQPDHADRALAAAREMTGPRLAAVNAGLERPLAMGVGMDSGRILAGNVGSQLRMEYTAIGDPANVAARVEGLTKEVGRPILLTAATVAALTAPDPALESIGERAVRGRRAPIELWSPVSG